MARRNSKELGKTGAADPIIATDATGNGRPDAAKGNGAGEMERVAIASAIRAFSAWLMSRGETVHAGALEPSDRLYRATMEFLRDRGIEGENYDPDWARTLDRSGDGS